MYFLTTCKVAFAEPTVFLLSRVINGTVALGRTYRSDGANSSNHNRLSNADAKTLRTSYSTMAKNGKSSIAGVNEYQRYVCSVVPTLEFGSHKGQCGRIGVIGGSEVFVGAPFYASMAALRLGADLVYVFTTQSAANPLKSYSPELMVHPYLDNKDCVQLMDATLPKLHALVVGCGLSSHPEVHAAVVHIIKRARELNMPIVLDASVFPLIVSQLDLVRGYKGAVLTPNFSEFKNLYKHVCKKEFTAKQATPESVEALASSMGNVTILAKGGVDIVSDGLSLVLGDETGSPRRCGGQGDILAGLLGVFSYWAFNAQKTGMLSQACPLGPGIVAGLGASMVTRRCARQAFRRMKRSTLSTDIVDEIRDSFAVLFPVD
ncbi:ATP-dependent (S)-NAD(P)H-hydrate dehydratase-like isoform X1 [Varroa destructor]|uniref:ATP-dependent (S)-NAD(P)H-hydrate dehydratase n=3 Tax=Varroa destructor TaxID=109461 RepID=A0A7M7K1A6_VARDE|nr:ATP-dependent (S)-NAD(P)H-hydrate dehydratase-like isoform X1 [Varroa destructor]